MSRKDSVLFAKEVIANPEKMDELMTYFFSDDLRICQMASFPIIAIADNKIDLLLPFLSQMVIAYHKAPHNAYKRNVLRTLQFVDIPENLEGEIYNICLEEFCDIKAPTALRVFGMTVMCNICAKHPELRHELLPTLKDYQHTGTTGFENRLRKEIIRVSLLADEH
ncbi:MAG: hypothetical protein V3V00_03355 [Saprospiraceae bacterium]